MPSVPVFRTHPDLPRRRIDFCCVMQECCLNFPHTFRVMSKKSFQNTSQAIFLSELEDVIHSRFTTTTPTLEIQKKTAVLIWTILSSQIHVIPRPRRRPIRTNTLNSRVPPLRRSCARVTCLPNRFGSAEACMGGSRGREGRSVSRRYTLVSNSRDPPPPPPARPHKHA